MSVVSGLNEWMILRILVGLWSLALGAMASTPLSTTTTTPAAGSTRAWNLVGFGARGPVTLELVPDASLCPLTASRQQTVKVAGTVPGMVTSEAVAQSTRGCPAWTVSCAGDAYCSATLSDTESSETGSPAVNQAPLAISVYPAVDVQGVVVVPRTVDLPETVSISGRVRPGQPLVPGEPELAFATTSTLSAEGAIAFKIPAGTVDLRLAAETLSPAYRWNVHPVDGTIDLGRLELVPGGSLLGYVIAHDTELPVPDVTITAIPAGIENAPIDDQEANRNTRTPATRSNTRGSFQLTALAPGAYRLRAEHPDYLPVEPAEIRVVRNAETILGSDIVLSDPLQLSVTIDPPISPSGHPWQVALESLATSRQTDTTEANANGRAVFEHLAPTALRVRVGAEDAFGVFETTLELRSDQELTVEIPIVEVLGRVTLTDEPVIGTLKIGTGNSDLWTTPLDHEGHFSTWLREPKLNVLFLTVNSKSFASPAEVIVENIVVDDGKIELDVELLDLEISGTVTDRRGTPIRDALVIARERTRIVAKVYSNSDGAFSMRPPQAGELRLKASRKGLGDSREQFLTLSESTPAIEAELVIYPNRWLEGSVTGPSGEPVAGARVITFSVDQDLVADTVGTDLEGHFRAEVAPESQEVVLLIAAQGYPFWSACIDSRQPASIQLAAAGGHLELRIDRENQDDKSKPEHFSGGPLFVNELGGAAPLNEVWAWARRHGVDSSFEDEAGAGYRFPNVSPGRWAAAWSTGSLAEHVIHSCNLAFGQGQGSDWATVKPGATSRLVLNRRP